MPHIVACSPLSAPLQGSPRIIGDQRTVNHERAVANLRGPQPCGNARHRKPNLFFTLCKLLTP